MGLTLASRSLQVPDPISLRLEVPAQGRLEPLQGPLTPRLSASLGHSQEPGETGPAWVEAWLGWPGPEGVWTVSPDAVGGVEGAPRRPHHGLLRPTSHTWHQLCAGPPLYVSAQSSGLSRGLSFFSAWDLPGPVSWGQPVSTQPWGHGLEVVGETTVVVT